MTAQLYSANPYIASLFAWRLNIFTGTLYQDGVSGAVVAGGTFDFIGGTDFQFIGGTYFDFIT